MDAKDRPNIVVPSNSPQRMRDFIDNWRTELIGCHLIIIWDLPSKPKFDLDISNEQYSHKEIKKELGKNSWIIPKKSSAVRSFGFLKAYKNQALFTVSLDDDTLPSKGHIQRFCVNLLGIRDVPKTKWLSTTKKFYPRGTPYERKKIILSHGGWLEVPDFSASEQLRHAEPNFTESDFNELIIGKGNFFSLCGMNFAFRPEYTKYLYFGLQGQGYPVSRADDIMAGVHLCKNLKKEEVIYSGKPFVIHRRASNVWNNLIKERYDKEVIDCFQNNKPGEFKEYFKKLNKAYKIWEKLCETI